MSKNLKKKAEFDTATISDHGLTPLAARAVFWRSRYLEKSAFLHHLPLSFWLAEVCRPGLVVQVGMDDAQCYFAFCQAVDKLNLSARCMGFGIWGDGKEMPKPMVAYNAANYPEFSKIETALPKEVKQRLGRRRVDLLISDLGSSDVDVEALEDLCKHSMTDRGCAMFYGINAALSNTQKAAFLDRLDEGHQTVWFDDNAGVVLVLIGDHQDSRLAQLAELEDNSPEYYNIQSVFSRLGAGHYNEWLSKDRLAQALAAKKSANEAEQRAKKLAESVASLESAYAERDEAAADSQIALYELRQEIETQEREGEKTRTALEANLSKTQTSLAEQKAQAEELRAALDNVRAEFAEQKEALKKALEDKRQAEEKQNQGTAAIAEQQEQVGQVRAELDTARAELAVQKETLETVLAEKKTAENDLSIQKENASATATALSDAQTELSKQSDVLDALRAEKDQVTAALAEQQEAVANIQAALDESRTEIGKLGSANDGLLQELNEARETQKVAEEQFVASEFALVRIRKERDAAHAALESDKEAADRAQADLMAQHKLEVSELQQELQAVKSAFSEAVESHASDHAELIRQHEVSLESALSAEKARAANEQDIRFREIAVLTKQFSDLEVVASEAAGATTSAEAIKKDLADLQVTLQAAKAESSQQRDERFRETAALTQSMLEAEQEMSQHLAAKDAAYKKLYADYSKLLAEHKLLEVEAIPARIGEIEDRWFRETAALTAEIEKLISAQAASEQAQRAAEAKATKLQQELAQERSETGLAISQLQSDLAWRTRKAKESRQRFETQLKLRNWQISELQETMARRKLRGNLGFRSRVKEVEESRHFDSRWYVETYPDVAEFSGTPAEHFLRYGMFEGRNPSPKFETIGYYIDNPDALDRRLVAVLDAPG